MLEIVVPEVELWDEAHQEFVSVKTQTLELEHSLVSLSKWESKWCKPFLKKENKNSEEVLDYVRCMTLNKNVNPNVYICLSDENHNQINKYIDAPMTATTITERNPKKGKSEQLTAELIYYYMFAFNIPIECQKWHLNRLITLIKVCSIKSEKPKTMSKRSILANNAAINAARKSQLHTNG